MLPILTSVLPQGACQIYYKYGHSAHVYPRGNFAYRIVSLTTPFAIMFVCDSSNSNWILDFGATLHLTPNASAMSSSQPHIGMFSVIASNGNSLLISHQGSMYLFKSLYSSITLYLMSCVFHRYER